MSGWFAKLRSEERINTGEAELSCESRRGGEREAGVTVVQESRGRLLHNTQRVRKTLLSWVTLLQRAKRLTQCRILQISETLGLPTPTSCLCHALHLRE